MDAVRESLAARRARYEQDFREWMLLRHQDEGMGSFMDLLDFEAPDFLPMHPHFPSNLELELWGQELYVVGYSKWRTGCKPQDIPDFTREYQLAISVQKPTSVKFEKRICAFSKWFGNDGGHLGVLILAWAYILSARWAEIMPGAEISYTAQDDRLQEISEDHKLKDVLTLATGAKNAAALHWWTALIAQGRWWSATISKSGKISLAPWSTSISMSGNLAVRVIGTEGAKNSVAAEQRIFAPSSKQAIQYLAEYCEYHGILKQRTPALSVALLLPLVRSSRRSIRLPVPQSSARQLSADLSSTSITPNQEQLDKLLILSCNYEGIQAILSSCFLNPDVPGNVCSHYLQGVFAVIDSTHDIQACTSLLMRGLGRLGFLWLGAGISGLKDGFLNLFRVRISEPDLHSAAWTQTLQSFIQQPVSGIRNGRVTRADECKLLFLTQTKWHTNPPLSAWRPFGTTELKDVNLEVEEHIRCESHCLFYDSWTWNCRNENGSVSHRPNHNIPRLLPAQRIIDLKIPVSYHAFDPEEESALENTTLNNFNWLRRTDGYPVAERDLRNHEWLKQDTDSNDIESEDSDQTHNGQKSTRTRARGLPTKWLMDAKTKRARADSV